PGDQARTLPRDGKLLIDDKSRRDQAHDFVDRGAAAEGAQHGARGHVAADLVDSLSGAFGVLRGDDADLLQAAPQALDDELPTGLRADDESVGLVLANTGLDEDDVRAVAQGIDLLTADETVEGDDPVGHA